MRHKNRLGLQAGLNPSLTFEAFVVGSTNRFAYSCALEVATNPALQYNPLYMFGQPSVGKTHLLNAIGNRVLTHRPDANVSYVPVSVMFSEHTARKAERNAAKMDEFYLHHDVLLVDDFDEISRRQKFQHTFVPLFDALYESKKQIVVAGKRPPSQIESLLPQLRSRMEWGLLSEIQVPDQRTKMRIIKEKAKLENLHIPDDVAFFLANTSKDLKVLTESLIALEAYTSLTEDQIEISTIKSLIKTRKAQNIRVQDIQKIVAGYFNISVSDLVSKKKTRQFSYPRQVAMFLSRRLTDLSFKKIGQAFYRKDHSTVIYGVKRIEEDRRMKAQVFADLEKIQSLLL